jgi:2-polyprenyl-3-methyl-5-hydroxy-6-metoxy-1,4-benzoquinol methylase
MEYNEAYYAGRHPLSANAFHHNLCSVLSRYCKRHARYADLGAGTGFLSTWLATDWGGQVTAVDGSEFALQNISKTVPGVRTLQLDLNTVTYAQLQGPYDVAFMVHCLEHLDDPAKVLRQVATCLAPDGRLIVVVPNCGWTFRRLVGDRTWGWNDPTHRHYFSVETLRQVMKTSFSDVSIQTYPVPGLWLWCPALARRLAFRLGNHLIAIGQNNIAHGDA